MNEANHFKALENMYAAAPINEIYNPVIKVSEGISEIEMEISEKFHHSAGGAWVCVFQNVRRCGFFCIQLLRERSFCPHHFIHYIYNTACLTR